MLVISSNHFEWDNARQWFFADISALEKTEFGHHDLDRRVINGVTQFGFWMKSARTGEELWFTRGNAERDDDCDILYWNYRAFNPANHSFLHLRIFND